MKLKRFISIPILSVLMLMYFVYYITVFIFLEDWVGLKSSAGSLNSFIFTFLALLSLFSFFVCVITDPGSVPSGFVPDVEGNGGSGSDQESKKSGSNLGRCEKCSAFKPARAHHCRVCRRCVLRMDHHCMWINNCVGHRNYKAFVVLVVYATIASLYSLVIIVGCAVQKEWDFDNWIRIKTFYITSGAMISLLSLTLGTLLGWHLYLIAHNMTTIEYYEGTRAAWLAKKSGQSYRHPFDVGAYKNMTLILGPNMVKWLWPTAISHLKEGVDFPTTKDSL